ncbi:hypothetical protein GCM10007049_16550 [Echinicola pacifica]|uniref:HTH araC/xylS-type domain-containing protein n=1 Tax=Echinicola pacifica TaxID=346377 RepID=A0A918PWX0_9BACT|nr:AraC family transcriptional regulator [Echinicola pacifica]GGZ24829.1 hypothetical protein GCM10007049_16550 [Echinicola pacifica]
MKAILEKVLLEDQDPVRSFVYHKGDFDAPYHFHPEMELTLIIESSGIRYVGNNISDYLPGDLVLLGTNIPHCWKNNSVAGHSSKSLVLQWREEIIADQPWFKDIRQLCHQAQRGLYLLPEYRKAVTEGMFKVLNSSKTEKYLRMVELLHYLATEVKFEVLAGASYSYDLSSATTDRLQKVQNYVKNHFHEKIKLADVAGHLHMSEQSFSRFFSKTWHKPFFVFLNEYRINIASRLVLETDKQMTEIAYDCGYESLAFFYKQFKKFKKHSPLEFRKMFQKI